MISQSCLEHVFPIEGTIDKLAEIQHAKTRFLHLVDFGNHYPTGNPLDGLYEQPRDDYIARRGKAMNLLRAPDIDALFKSRNIPAQGNSLTLREGDLSRPHQSMVAGTLR